MTTPKYDFAIEELRHMATNFGHCNESVNQRCKSIEELVTLHRAWMASGWDIYPDQWTERQFVEALTGKPPKWNDREQPIYDDEIGTCSTCGGPFRKTEKDGAQHLGPDGGAARFKDADHAPHAPHAKPPLPVIPERILREVRAHHGSLYDRIDNAAAMGDDEGVSDLYDPPLDLDEYDGDDVEAAFCIGYLHGVADALDVNIYALIAASTTCLEVLTSSGWKPVDQVTFFEMNAEEASEPLDAESRQAIVRLAPGEEYEFDDGSGKAVKVRRTAVSS